MQIVKSLSTEISVPVYRTLADAIGKGNVAKDEVLCAGERCVSDCVLPRKQT
jgi:hypothetical protein